MKYLVYDERPDLPPEALAYHERTIALGATAHGVEYAYGEHPLQRLLVFPATRPAGPVLCAIHGGRFCHGYKEWMAMMAPALNQRGITLVALGYRLAPEPPFPAGLEDCAEALTWVRSRTGEWGGSADAIFVGGHSSGAHFAALLAVASKHQRASHLPPLAGCVAMSDLYLIDKDSVPPPLLAILFPDGGNDGDFLRASPAKADLRNAPAFHITWGENDAPPVVMQSSLMAKALEQADVPVRTLVLPGLDHFAVHCAAAEIDGAWIQDVDAFMKSHRSK